jgi:ubiquinone/menaquinone biosynthesis C-methylase UbiE
MLDVGCGRRKMVGCIGVDLNRNSDADVLADAASLPFASDSVDYVYSRRCLQHVLKDYAALNEICRVLKVSGEAELIFASWRGWLYYHVFVRKPYDVFHLYWKGKLMRMLKRAGFHVKVLKLEATGRCFGRDWRVVAVKT